MSTVLVVTRRLDLGGTERHVARILPLLRASGIEVSLFVLERGGLLEAGLQAAGVSIDGPSFASSTPLRVARTIGALYGKLRAERPDIVHFFLPEPYLVGSVAAILARSPMRIMSRRSLANYQQGHPYLAQLERRLHRGTAAILGNSKAVVAELVAECGDTAKVGLIYNGIETGAPIPAEERAFARREFALSPDTLALVTVANLISYKGHDDLLQALALAQPKLPRDWRLLAAGRDDGVGAALRQRAAALGLHEHVHWLGERPDVTALLAAADIAVLASHQEGFSNSLIEAMAAGLPVVATAVGGNSDAVVPGQTGLLVPPREPAALSEAIVALAADATLRGRLGTQARQRAAAHFSMEACMQRYANLYRGAARIGRVPLQAIIDPPVERSPLPTVAARG